MQGGNRIKNYRLGSIKTKFYYDILGHTNCLSGSASRNTKRSFKRLASRFNRNLIKRLSQEEV